ncbi:hypothetical protein HK100_004116 [Physocladia obscura]|uniref:Uncharacterized protein n=1 Tax=Physocladia obscura TaxID=109957 RepID=A0AAD5SU77_9FUNG|nr:hypothetical protein HK100_004116 [Physocladia obscura]
MFGNKADKRQANWDRISGIAADRTAQGNPSRDANWSRIGAIAERNESIAVNPGRMANWDRFLAVVNRKPKLNETKRSALTQAEMQILQGAFD